MGDASPTTDPRELLAAGVARLRALIELLERARDRPAPAEPYDRALAWREAFEDSVRATMLVRTLEHTLVQVRLRVELALVSNEACAHLVTLEDWSVAPVRATGKVLAQATGAPFAEVMRRLAQVREQWPTPVFADPLPRGETQGGVVDPSSELVRRLEAGGPRVAFAQVHQPFWALSREPKSPHQVAALVWWFATDGTLLRRLSEPVIANEQQARVYTRASLATDARPEAGDEGVFVDEAHWIDVRGHLGDDWGAWVVWEDPVPTPRVVIGLCPNGTFVTLANPPHPIHIGGPRWFFSEAVADERNL